MGRAPFVSCNFFERRIAAAHIYQATVHIMIFNKEERTYWIESYKKFPTSPTQWITSVSAPESSLDSTR